MNKKLKKILIIFLFLIVTVGCVLLGFKTRFDNGIVVTQFAPQTTRQSMGYMLKTSENRIVMIDGGTEGDTEHVKKAIIDNGGIVDTWFLTHAHDDHYGVLLTLLNEMDSNIQINNIYLNLNSEEWYKENDSARFDHIKLLLDVLKKDGVKEKVHIVQNRDEIVVDNLIFKILKITSPEVTVNAGNNQSLVIKVSNMFKSMIFLGDSGEEVEENIVNHNLDEIKCDAVQMAHHGQSGVSEFTYNAIDPKICFWPTPEWLWDNNKGEGFNTAEYKTIETRAWIEYLGVKENYIAKDGDITVKIW